MPEGGPLAVLWLVAGVVTFPLRWALSAGRRRGMSGEPGVYRCGDCGESFTFVF
jgi:hypothetical protein